MEPGSSDAKDASPSARPVGNLDNTPTSLFVLSDFAFPVFVENGKESRHFGQNPSPFHDDPFVTVATFFVPASTLPSKESDPIMTLSGYFDRSSRLGIALALTSAGIFLAGCSDPQAEDPVAPKTPRLVVSQILYHNPGDSLEWLELRNDGDAPAPLAGIAIDAIGWKFPATASPLAAGAHLILTNSAALFTARYPGVEAQATYSGRLADEGETVELKGPEGVGFEVGYQEREPWPVSSARQGRSLVYQGGDPKRPASWGVSNASGGQPGRDCPTVNDPGIWISEMRPANDAGQGFVELYNAATSSVDISGWILSDGNNADTLPSGTTLRPGERLALRQSAGPDESPWGALRPQKTGGELVLEERDASGSFTGAAHSLRWKGIPDGMSFGRVPAGDALGTGLIAPPTPQAANEHSRIGLVTIQEICYDPAKGDAEFVELRNETDSAIHLGVTGSPDRSWSLSGTGKTFSAEETIPAHGRMILVSKDDATPEAFRAKWSIPSATPVVTYSGRLDNGGETLELRHPSIAVAQNGALDWASVVEDAAWWSSSEPWPAKAHGGGECLQRLDPSLPGSLPAAWTSSLPTPGR